MFKLSISEIAKLLRSIKQRYILVLPLINELPNLRSNLTSYIKYIKGIKAYLAQMGVMGEEIQTLLELKSERKTLQALKLLNKVANKDDQLTVLETSAQRSGKIAGRLLENLNISADDSEAYKETLKALLIHIAYIGAIYEEIEKLINDKRIGSSIVRLNRYARLFKVNGLNSYAYDIKGIVKKLSNV